MVQDLSLRIQLASPPRARQTSHLPPLHFVHICDHLDPWGWILFCLRERIQPEAVFT